MKEAHQTRSTSSSNLRSAFTIPIKRSSTVGHRESESDLGFRYSIREFLDDHERIVSAVAPRATVSANIIELIDGRMVIISELLVAGAVDEAQTMPATLVEKYGPPRARVVLSKIRLAVSFLSEWRAEICGAGLAEIGESMQVREEFLHYLLNCHTDRARARISKDALDRFIDEWSYRWK